MRKLPWLAASAALLWCGIGNADIAPVAAPEELWWQWSLDPVFPLLLAPGVLAYARGARTLGRRLPRWRAGAFWGALACLGIAIVSPLDAWGAALFSAHMAQHLVLTAVAAPLFALSWPWRVCPRGLPPGGRRFTARVLRSRPLRKAGAPLRNPLVALTLHALLLWLWHVPAWYEAAFESELVHWLEHGTLLGSSVLFWKIVDEDTSRGTTIVYLFGNATQSALLGALITLSPVAWYTVHEAGTRTWGLTPLGDQQLAGLLMWVPGGVVYLLAALLVFGAWLRQADRVVKRRQDVWGGLRRE